jgi:hypothetical protein
MATFENCKMGRRVEVIEDAADIPLYTTGKLMKVIREDGIIIQVNVTFYIDGRSINRKLPISCVRII